MNDLLEDMKQQHSELAKSNNQYREAAAARPAKSAFAAVGAAFAAVPWHTLLPHFGK